MKANGLGLVLRAERVKRNLSQLDLAIASGLSLNTVHRVERSGSVTPETARKLAAALGVKPSLLTGAEDTGRGLKPTPIKHNGRNRVTGAAAV